MKKITKLNFCMLFFVLSLLSFTGCNSSHLVSTWKEPEIKSLSFEKFFVISVNNNNAKRKQWEETIVQALNSHGVQATPSYKNFPKEIPDSTALNSFLGNKFDAVLMIHKTDERLYKYRTPGYVAVYPMVGFRSRFYHSYARIYNEVYFPGSIEREKIYQLETNVYEQGEDGRLIWSAVTQTSNPKSTQEFSKDILEIIIPKLVADGIIPGQK